ncbi:metalloprotease PmbA [soil metagenome]
MTTSAHFSHSPDQLRDLADQVLSIARDKGATDCVMEASEGSGLSVAVRMGRVETIEQNRDKGLSVTVYQGARKGYASTADFSRKALEDTVQAAYDIARYTAEDVAAGLPDDDQLETSPRDLGLFHEWNLDVETAIELTSRAEAAALATDPRIRNSEGASISAQHSHFVLANSRGFIGGYPYSRHYISCAPIAQHRRAMQRDDWYSSQRDPKALAAPEAIGRYAAQRALARLGARSVPTRKCPVLFEAPLACGLLGAFTQAAAGSALYRKSTFLLESLGQRVFADHVGILEDPHVQGGMGSAPFDEEGVRTVRREVVSAGVVNGWFLSTYSARKLGLKTTGNAGGSHNLSLVSSKTHEADNLDVMLRKLGTGLFVTELMGQGVNYVTGDYSRGASGYWVENGQIVHPVEEVTIAGNLKQMFQSIVAIGADTLVRGSNETGSILIEQMTVAGT